MSITTLLFASEHWLCWSTRLTNTKPAYTSMHLDGPYVLVKETNQPSQLLGFQPGVFHIQQLTA